MKRSSSFLRVDLGGQHVWIFRPGIADRSPNDRFRKSNLSKLIEEGPAFLGTGYSSKPICLTLPHLWGKRAAQYKFGRVDRPILPDDSRELLENGVPCRIQVKDTIH